MLTDTIIPKAVFSTFERHDTRRILRGRVIRIQNIDFKEKSLVFLRHNNVRITPLVSADGRFDFIELSLPCGSVFEYELDVDFSLASASSFLSITIIP